MKKDRPVENITAECLIKRGYSLYYYKKDDNGEIVCRDGYTTDTIKETADINMFVPVFRDGKMLREYSLAEIRNRLHGGKF